MPEGASPQVEPTQQAQTMPSVPAMEFSEAVKVAEAFADIDQIVDKASAFFRQGIADLSEESYEKRALYYYYLLKLLLRKNLSSETPMALQYYCKMVDNMKSAKQQMDKQLEEATEQRMKNMLKSQMKAYIKIQEKMFSSLEKSYADKGFGEALDRAYVDRMHLKTQRAKIEGNMGIYVSLSLFEKTSNYGLSFLRWGVSMGIVLLVFAVLYAFSDVMSAAPIVSGANNFGLDYLYFSTVTFTTLGFGDLVPVELLPRLFVMVEVVLGYLMLGLFVHLLLKKV